jgi:hypothetical protein
MCRAVRPLAGVGWAASGVRVLGRGNCERRIERGTGLARTQVIAMGCTAARVVAEDTGREGFVPRGTPPRPGWNKTLPDEGFVPRGTSRRLAWNETLD